MKEETLREIPIPITKTKKYQTVFIAYEMVPDFIPVTIERLRAYVVDMNELDSGDIFIVVNIPYYEDGQKLNAFFTKNRCLVIFPNDSKYLLDRDVITHLNKHLSKDAIICFIDDELQYISQIITPNAKTQKHKKEDKMEEYEVTCPFIEDFEESVVECPYLLSTEMCENIKICPGCEDAMCNIVFQEYNSMKKVIPK